MELMRAQSEAIQAEQNRLADEQEAGYDIQRLFTVRRAVV